jgi:DNA-binding HxlR family transcriptional regulator
VNADPERPESSIQQTLDVIGDRWTMLILRDIFRGVRRFTPLHGDLGIAKNLLADRLTRLVDNGVLERVPYQQRPVRQEYHLTPKGVDLSSALVALMQWGDRWYADGAPPTLLIHDECGTPLQQEVRCPSCAIQVAPAHIRSRPGPGDPSAEVTPIRSARVAI